MGRSSSLHEPVCGARVGLRRCRRAAQEHEGKSENCERHVGDAETDKVYAPYCMCYTSNVVRHSALLALRNRRSARRSFGNRRVDGFGHNVG